MSPCFAETALTVDTLEEWAARTRSYFWNIVGPAFRSIGSSRGREKLDPTRRVPSVGLGCYPRYQIPDHCSHHSVCNRIPGACSVRVRGGGTATTDVSRTGELPAASPRSTLTVSYDHYSCSRISALCVPWHRAGAYDNPALSANARVEPRRFVQRWRTCIPTSKSAFSTQFQVVLSTCGQTTGRRMDESNDESEREQDARSCLERLSATGRPSRRHNVRVFGFSRLALRQPARSQRPSRHPPSRSQRAPHRAR